MNFFDKFFDFVFDERKKISSKAAIIILVLFGIILVNNILGISNNYVINNKIEQIEKLNLIISNPTSDNITITSAKKIREEVLSKRNILECLFDYFDKLEFNEKNSSGNISELSKKINSLNQPNIVWFYLTASGIYYFLGIVVIFLMLFIDKVSSISQRIAVTLVLMCTFFAIGQFFYWICSLIPMILSTSWLLNYLLNLIIQIGSIFIFSWISIKMQKK